ncbi:hypothetical protein, partial [Tetragenococcus halophilus]|uniref:hypothetical protein n=1 Tax=Tetragenococcus halophilus TaxID=51669 RepID=UPI002A96835E|nr:hypothetical protein TEHSL10_03860 [Tetragenococcus halophilus]
MLFLYQKTFIYQGMNCIFELSSFRSEGKILSVDSFGYSGDPEEVMEAFGFTVGNVVNKFKSL